MKRFYTFGLAALVTIGLATTAWSQAGQAGAGGGAGGAGNAGGGGAAGAGGAAPANQPGAAGPAAAPSAAGTANGAGALGQTGAAGTTPAGATAGVPGTTPGGSNSGFGTAGNPSGLGNVGANGQRNGRVESQAAARSNMNNINNRPFFGDPGVQRQLNMNRSQFNTLNRSYQDAYGRYNQNMRGLNANLNEQQRLAQTQQFENQFRTDFGRSLDSTLNNPQARARYEQLNRQYSGFNTFNDPSVQQQLNLTPQQRVQLQRMAGDWQNQLSKSQRNGTQLNQQQWEQMWSRNWDQLNGVFTPEQRQTWTQLSGERYAFTPDMYRSGSDVNTDGNVGVQRDAGNGDRIVPSSGANQTPAPGSNGSQVAPQLNGGQATPAVPQGVQPNSQQQPGAGAANGPTQ